MLMPQPERLHFDHVGRVRQVLVHSEDNELRLTPYLRIGKSLDDDLGPIPPGSPIVMPITSSLPNGLSEAFFTCAFRYGAAGRLKNHIP